MTKDKVEDGAKKSVETTAPTTATTTKTPLERLAELTRKVLAVPKSEIDKRAAANKR